MTVRLTLAACVLAALVLILLDVDAVVGATPAQAPPPVAEPVPQAPVDYLPARFEAAERAARVEPLPPQF